MGISDTFYPSWLYFSLINLMKAVMTSCPVHSNLLVIPSSSSAPSISHQETVSQSSSQNLYNHDSSLLTFEGMYFYELYIIELYLSTLKKTWIMESTLRYLNQIINSKLLQAKKKHDVILSCLFIFLITCSIPL